MSQRIIPFRDLEEERRLFGNLDRNLHLLRRLYEVDAVSRGGVLKISGDPEAIERAGRAAEAALGLLRGGQPLEEGDLERAIRIGGQPAVDEHVPSGASGRPRLPIEPRTENQSRYLDVIHENPITFAIGPAGSGKSFLAMAAGVAYLKAGVFRRLVLARPAVEAGESLGFLPGDLAAKVDPYLRPLYDALHAMLPRAQVERYVEENVVEILPLAYMRGRTLDHAYVVLDEAQNCTHTQMKMALTRLGQNAKMVVTGDVTQVDLPSNKTSGLASARRILSGIDGIGWMHLAKTDIVRHPLVGDIVKAYGRDEDREREAARGRLGRSVRGDERGRPAEREERQP